jgi:hypothetical protein
VSPLTNQVFALIEMTKSHKIPSNADFDMQFFSDIDMGILGSTTNRYKKYAAQIRLEFNFVEFKTFCTKRSDFLLSCLATDQPIFGTDLFQQERGQQALQNIAWEHSLLKSFQCPVKLYNQSNDSDIATARKTITTTKSSDGCGGMVHSQLLLHIFMTVVLVFPPF